MQSNEECVIKVDQIDLSHIKEKLVIETNREDLAIRDCQKDDEGHTLLKDVEKEERNVKDNH